MKVDYSSEVPEVLQWNKHKVLGLMTIYTSNYKSPR